MSVMIEEMNRQIVELLALPALIAEKMAQCNQKEEIGGMQGQIKDILEGFEVEAGMEVDDNGKKIYTNATMRAARAKELAEKDDLYKQCRRRLAELIDTKTRLDLEINQLQNQFSAIKAVLYAKSEMLAYETAKIAVQTRTMEVKVV